MSDGRDRPKPTARLAARVARGMVALAGLAAASLSLLGALPAWRAALAAPLGVDFVSFHAAARLALTAPTRLYDLTAQEAAQSAVLGGATFTAGVLPFPYPPFVAALLAPLGALAFAPAYFLMSAVGVAALAAMVARLARGAAGWRMPPAWAALACAACLGVSVALVQGQLAPLLALLWTLHALDAADGRDRRAGVWLGLLAAKPTWLPVALLAALARRRWATLAAAAATAGALFGLSAAWVGVEGLRAWLALAARLGDPADPLAARVHPAAMQNLRALLTAAGGGGEYREAWIAAAGALAAISALLVARRPEAPRGWAAAAVATALAAPHLHLHDLTLLAPAAALVAADAGRTPTGRLAAGLALAAWPIAALAGPPAGALAWPPVPAGLAVAWGLLAVAAWRAPRHRGARPPSPDQASR